MGRGRTLSDEKINAIIELAKQGYRKADIARMVGCSITSVDNYAYDYYCAKTQIEIEQERIIEWQNEWDRVRKLFLSGKVRYI